MFYNIILVEKSAGIVIVKLNYNDIRMFSIEYTKLEKSHVNIYVVCVLCINVELFTLSNYKEIGAKKKGDKRNYRMLESKKNTIGK